MAVQVTLPYPPYNSPLVDSTGILTQPWAMWFQQLYVKNGGTTPVNPSIQSVILASMYASNVIIVNNIVQPFYIVPITLTQTILDSLTAKNNSSVPVTLSVWVVPQGQTPNSTNIVLNNSSIAGNSIATIPAIQGQILGTGAYVAIQAGAPGVILCTLKGRQIS